MEEEIRDDHKLIVEPLKVGETDAVAHVFKEKFSELRKNQNLATWVDIEHLMPKKLIRDIKAGISS